MDLRFFLRLREDQRRIPFLDLTHEHRIALLIDADNSPADMIDEVLDELAKEGVINIRRAYGDWKSPHLSSWAAPPTAMPMAKPNRHPPVPTPKLCAATPGW
ncbi:MAG TPA: hypothetical protein PLE48_08330 [Thiobacillus sp.]|nr:hypothetical protein [Thiobacillus sp.]HQT70419.1 hypothetical protein [Thiobacillus sp.]